MKILNILIFILLLINTLLSGEVIIKKIMLNISKDDEGISPIYDDYAETLIVGGISMDEKQNIYIADIGDSSIKKFNNNGKFLGKVKQKNVQFVDAYYFNGKIFSLDQHGKKNDLYVFDSNTLEILFIKKHIYTPNAGGQPCFFRDNLLIIDQLNKFHVYNLSNNEMVYNLKSPFDYYKDLSLDELMFLWEHARFGHNPEYLGRLGGYFLFFKEDYDHEDKFELAMINIEDNKTLKSEFTYSRNRDTLGTVLSKDIRLSKSGIICASGFEDGKLVINLIDIKKLFPNSGLMFK